MKLPGTTHIKRQQIQDITQHSLRYLYFFPKSLEKSYQKQYQHQASAAFRYRTPIILVLYSFLSLGIHQEIKISMAWFSYYVWVGILVMLAWACCSMPRLKIYFDYYITAIALLCIAITFVMIAAFDQHNTILLHVAMMYAVIIVYAFTGLRFYHALIAGWGGGLLGIAFVSIYEYEVNWTLLNRTYTFSSFLGMALAYVNDYQNRANYLQNCLIQLDQQQLTQQAKQLEILSRHDALTGLANRHYMQEVLDREWAWAMRHQMPITLMLLDIDYFKNYNDHLGHLQGDQCLKKIATLLQYTTSRSNELAVRYGGEEFLLIYPLIDQEKSQTLAQHLMKKLHQMNIAHPNSPISSQVTMSIGIISFIPHPQQNLQQYLQYADQALYQAKVLGRNRYQILDFNAAPQNQHSSM